jgi:hypothetical protein
MMSDARRYPKFSAPRQLEIDYFARLLSDLFMTWRPCFSRVCGPDFLVSIFLSNLSVNLAILYSTLPY